MLKYDWLLTALLYSLIGDLHNGIILPLREECFVKVLCYSEFSSLLGTKKQLLFKFVYQQRQFKAVWSTE